MVCDNAKRFFVWPAGAFIETDARSSAAAQCPESKTGDEKSFGSVK